MSEPQQEICLDCAPACDLPATSTSNGNKDKASQEQPIKQATEEDIMNPETFAPPSLASGPNVYIEYCDRCRWAPRASWISTELFLTFPNPVLSSISLLPSVENAGRFRVWLNNVPEGSQIPEGCTRRDNGWILVWDRKVEGAFPELKLLKQRIRNLVQPKQDLGHSDKAGHKAAEGQ